MEKTVYIVRHGQTDYNKMHIIQGSGVDSSLNETGRRQAQAFFEHYQYIPFEVVLTSALKRTQETLAPFIEKGLPWESYTQINEMCWGIYEGQPADVVMKQEYKTITGAWTKGEYDAKIDEGESATEMGERLQWFVDHLRQRSEETILVCSHGRAMRGLMCLLQQQPLKLMDTYKHANTGLYLVDYSPDVFTFKLKNDVRHLENVVF